MAYRILRHSGHLQQLIRSCRLEKISRKMCSSISSASNSNVKESIFKMKLNQLVQWYEETTGMDEVRMAQKRVLEAEEKFIGAQERRRETNKKVVELQNKLKDLYAELDNTTRGEERYVALITEEHKLLKQERQITNEFQRYEREEREHFSALSSAVKESHEKERAQAERTKYWSIIGSIIGTIIGIIGSSINNELKMKELRRLIKESNAVQRPLEVSSDTPGNLLNHEKKLNYLADEVNASLKQNNVIANKLNNVITVLDNKVKTNVNSDSDSVLNALSQQQQILEKNLSEMNAILSVHLRKDSINYDNIDMFSQDQHSAAKMLFLSTVIIAFPIVFRYFDLFS